MHPRLNHLTFPLNYGRASLLIHERPIPYGIDANVPEGTTVIREYGGLSSMTRRRFFPHGSIRDMARSGAVCGRSFPGGYARKRGYHRDRHLERTLRKDGLQRLGSCWILHLGERGLFRVGRRRGIYQVHHRHRDFRGKRAARHRVGIFDKRRIPHGFFRHWVFDR